MKSIQYYLDALHNIVLKHNQYFEGNIFYLDNTHTITNTFKTKRDNLSAYSKNKAHILEIGFNAGHSCLLFLLSNPYSKIQCFDIGEHPYSRECFDFLQKEFPNRLKVVWGNSLETIPAFRTNLKYDLIHIDGGHTENILKADILNCRRLSHSDTIVFIDDISFHPEYQEDCLNKAVVEMFLRGVIVWEPLDNYSNYHIMVKYKN